jgi:hypothetical protein
VREAHRNDPADRSEGDPDLIVPAGGRSIRKEPSQLLAAKALRPSRSKWAELLRRVVEIDALRCPYCGGKRRLIALLTDGKVVRKILEEEPAAATSTGPRRPGASPTEASISARPARQRPPENAARTAGPQVGAWMTKAPPLGGPLTEALAAGVHPATALVRAQRALLARRNDAHAAFWAAFMVHGQADLLR